MIIQGNTMREFWNIQVGIEFRRGCMIISLGNNDVGDIGLLMAIMPKHFVKL